MFTSVYLCVKENNNRHYNCKKFKDFEQANRVFREYYDKKNISSTTMIPVCNFNPFYKLELWYKLSKVFIFTKIN